MPQLDIEHLPFPPECQCNFFSVLFFFSSPCVLLSSFAENDGEFLGAGSRIDPKVFQNI